MFLELTLLGFVSLILLLFQKYLPDICIPYKGEGQEWTLLSNMGSCPCCLKDTAGLTTCAQMYQGCAVNGTTRQPFCGCDAGWAESTYAPPPGQAVNPYCQAYETSESKFVMRELVINLQSAAAQAGLSTIELFNSVLDTPTGAPGVPPGPTMRRKALSQGSPSSQRRLQQIAVSIGNETTPTNLHIIPEVATFRCEGPFYSGSCQPGYHPAISQEALNQMHIFLFILGIVHVVVSSFVMGLANLRVWQWRRWQKQGKVFVTLEEIIAAHPDEETGLESRSNSEEQERQRADRYGPLDPGMSHKHKPGWPPLPIHPDVNEEIQFVELSDASAPYSAECFHGMDSDEEAPNPIPVANEEGPNAVPAGELTTLPPAQEIQRAASSQKEARTKSLNKKPPSKAPSRKSSSKRRSNEVTLKALVKKPTSPTKQRFKEVGTALLQAFNPNLVSHEDYFFIRRAYLGILQLPEGHNFVRDMQLYLDYDSCRIIGASFTMLIILILQWALSGLAGWLTTLLLLLAAVTLVGVNAGLSVAIQRCRRLPEPQTSGRFNRLRSIADPRWLAIPISGVLFLCSSIYSMAIFFVWQFGASSCLFSTKNQQMWMWLPGSIIPWWVGLLVPGVMICWLAIVTVPSWILVSHIRPREGGFSGCTGPKQGRKPLLVVGGVRHDSTEWANRAEVAAEISRLQEILLQLHG